MNKEFEEVEIEKLFNQLVEAGNKIHTFKDYELINCVDMNLYTKSKDNKDVKINFLSRHKTTKHLLQIFVCDSSILCNRDITVTSDHVCMIRNKNNFFENVNAKNLQINDYVSMIVKNKEIVGIISNIVDLGETSDYVYDCEVEDDEHCFYANNILIHNSQFANIQCVTEFFIKKFNLPKKLSQWSDEYKLKLWNFIDKFVEEKVNPFVQNLIKDKCFSEHPEVLRYSLEYIADCGIYEQKKRYCCHKVISEGPEICDKLKYTGIELKRSNVSPAIKEFLKDIYENTILNDWNNSDYVKYINDAYDKFCKMDINDIAFWKGWSSDKIESDGFLKGGKGMTGISKCCHFYNEMITHLKIGKKYDSIKVGDKVRMCYIQPNNQYGIDCIAFIDGQWPSEFNNIFSVDYMKMFTKTVLDPLKSFRIATKFDDVNPSEAMIEDIFAL